MINLINCTLHTYYLSSPHERRGYLYWSEGIGDVIYRSNMNGSNIEALLNTSIEVVGEWTQLFTKSILYHVDITQV